MAADAILFKRFTREQNRRKKFKFFIGELLVRTKCAMKLVFKNFSFRSIDSVLKHLSSMPISDVFLNQIQKV